MGLGSKLLTKPTTDPKLENCLVRDAAHITRGSRGDHVKRIQTALQVSRRYVLQVGEAIAVDGEYGTLTANAVKAYKNSKTPKITQPSQQTADDIVGKRTIQRLDKDVAALEARSNLVSITELGDTHDHSQCPASGFSGVVLGDGRVHHEALPINPRRTGLMISIGGEGEASYLGFQDVTLHDLGSEQRKRRITAGPFNRVPPNSVSDICVRDAPLSKKPAGGDASSATFEEAARELRRIAQPGCRLTFASNDFTVQRMIPNLLTLGTIIEFHLIRDPDPKSKDGLHHTVAVVVIR
ncbi:peptidoglycan-binding domain-containing protein [Tautonia plasticadhaerens]|uniref:Peptidoglycan binding domain protein n=1 Tax=Tautonia plasticadhaerens TaxID=2527974 RepID=A0A518HAE1_9BACT|nr:peptidoglycan-binding protein [Tautonia plasticadhaerens]QDV37821.1 hypothetical protein ElP_57680 [Tautonia plasticadhaerens]